MSVELRITGGYPCEDCGPKPIGYQRRCVHELECDWGIFHNAESNPLRSIEHLMLTTPDYVQKLLTKGPQRAPYGGIHSAATQDGRIFAYLHYGDMQWTWEMFDAHWWDAAEHGFPPHSIMVGRWPD